MKNLPCFGLRSHICIKLELYVDYIHMETQSNLNAHQIYISFPFGNNFTTTTTTTIVSLLFHNISLLGLNKEYQHQSVKMKNGLNDLPTCTKILKGSNGWIIHTFFYLGLILMTRKFEELVVYGWFWGIYHMVLLGQFQRQLLHF